MNTCEIKVLPNSARVQIHLADKDIVDQETSVPMETANGNFKAETHQKKNPDTSVLYPSSTGDAQIARRVEAGLLGFVESNLHNAFEEVGRMLETKCAINWHPRSASSADRHPDPSKRFFSKCSYVGDNETSTSNTPMFTGSAVAKFERINTLPNLAKPNVLPALRSTTSSTAAQI